MPHIERLQRARAICLAEPSGNVMYMSRYTTPDTPCGTVHCVIGACAFDPWFQEHTSILDILDIEGDTAVSKTRLIMLCGRGWALNFMPQYLANMFGISEADAERVFYADNDPVPKARVLANLDALIAGRPPRAYNSKDWPSPQVSLQPKEGDDDERTLVPDHSRWDAGAAYGAGVAGTLVFV